MFDTQIENRMKNHLSVVTWENNKKLSEVPIDDPFHHTRIDYEVTFSLWERIKILFGWPHKAELRVHVRSDGVSQGRWFQRAIICDHCKRTRIDDPRHPLEHDHGYHHGDERWCEDCYYEKPIESKPVSLTDNSNESA